MSFLVNPFSRSSQAGNAWFCAGAVTSYPNLDDSTRVGEQRPCGQKHVAGCRVFHVPRDDSSKATEVAIDDWKDPEVGGDAKDQVMVFKYKGKFVAVNHVCRDPIFTGTVPMLTQTCTGMPTLFVSTFQRHTFRH
jgi:hypothetical protein